MPRPQIPSGLKVWRIRGLRGLELERVEHAAARRAPQLHAEYEIAVVERGAMRVRHNRMTHVAEPGSLVVIPPGEVHSHDPVNNDVASRSFFPDLTALADASSSGGASRRPNFRQLVVRDAHLARRIASLHRLLERRGSMLARETLAVEAAALLVSRHAADNDDTDRSPREDDAAKYIRERLQAAIGENVTLGELTALTGLPAYTLVRAFQRRFGMPPHAYHLQVRVNRAKQLLARGEPATIVAASTGFVDQSHLTRHFKRLVGLTPGAYTGAAEP